MPATPAPRPATLPAPVADLMPHRRPARLIEKLLEIQARGGCTRALIRPDSPFTNPDGTLERTAYLELMAQTYAAVKGWRDRQHGRPPRVGYLVGATGVACLGTARIRDQLTTTIQETGTFGAFKLVQGHVDVCGQPLASGQLRIWLAPPHSASGTLDKAPLKEISHPPTRLRQAIKAAAANPLEWEAARRIVQSFSFPPEFIAFQGHFPGIALMPAFVQVQIAQVMLEAAWQAPLQLARIDKAKFREPLRPGQTVHVRCRLEKAPDSQQATVALTVTDRPVSTYQIAVRTTAPAPE